MVLGIGILIFWLMGNPDLEYTFISYIVAALGTTTSLTFLFLVREVPLSEKCLEKAK
jgi:hypothetical protein